MSIHAQIRMIILGVIVLTLSFIVIIRNKSLDDELLAIIGALGGIAIIYNAIVTNSKENKD